MFDENGNIYEENTAATPEESAPAAPQEPADIPKVEAEKVYERPFEREADTSYSEYQRQSAQYSPYGSRPYNPSGNHENASRSQQKNEYRVYNYNQPTQSQVCETENNNDSNKGLKIFAAIVSILLVFALVFSGVIIFKQLKGTQPENITVTNPPKRGDAENAPAVNIAAMPENALTTREIAEKVKPAIVGIVVYTNNSGKSAGEGTGVIWEEDATGTYTYIITCAHVISDPGIKVRVQTENGTMYDGEIVGLDSRTDLGVVKIKATGLPKAELGDSDALRVGDNVFAIGNPGGVEFFGSFTGGYVSAIDRPVSSEIGYTMKCIQHDAAINPGNSGGALVNVYGQVIGINSQKIAATDYEGMGFAIPMSSAKQIIEELTQFGYIPNRPKLGISYYPVSASTQYSMIAQIQGLPAGTLIIDKIDSESSLAKTEARQYDMIIAVNGQDLTTADILLELIENSKVGTKLTLTLCRVNSNYTISKFDVEVTLVEDKSTSNVEATEPNYVDPFEYYNPYGY
ncbi:MAG: trypsin-like peptidase domain-containing protein [Clostridia bacterium]|nr:trypsin-like peptidase domain-containing protein [Clostridia bacterium]